MIKKFINYCKNNRLETFFITILIVLILILVSLFSYGIYNSVKYQKWYNSLSVEEKAIEDKRKEKEYNDNIYKYEIVSVSKYIKNETNNFGGITDTETCYSFTYLDNKGKTHHIDDFYHTDYGLWKVTVGDKNLYIVNNNGEITRTLQLTEETYKKFN